MAITIDPAVRHQTIDGFGICAAFQRAELMRGAWGLPPAAQREVLDLLFSTTDGAGVSILRLGIGSSGDGVYDHMRSIAPTDPGGPDAPARYEWDGRDSGQVWLAQRALEYGVRRFYACAWSAPGYMMSNGRDTGGGTLGGLPGAPGDSGDWRAAYADYLLEYVRCYHREGVEITHLGFANEPDLFLVRGTDEIGYAAMRMDPAQVVDFVKVLGPAIERSGLPVSMVCCDAMSWAQQEVYTSAIEADPEAARWVSVHAGHNYVEPARWKLPTDRHTWMSEWEPNVEANTWIAGWDTGTREDGLRLAEDIHGALTEGQVNGYVYWFGASVGGTRALVRLDGADYEASKRLWALAGFSRFVRPGAVRVAASATNPRLKVSAFVDDREGTVLTIINTANRTVREPLTLASRGMDRPVASYLTDEGHSLSAAAAVDWSQDGPVVRIPARSMLTLVGL